jgi:uncharacterized protein DUF998
MITGITKALFVCGVVAGPLFTVAWIVEDATRANYDPLRCPISSLSIGDAGWMQIATFIITGLLVLAFAIGLRSALRPSGSVWGPALVGLAGIGLIGAGIFVTDPLNGYPPGTPLIPTERTIHGILHDLFGIPFFSVCPSPALYSRGASPEGASAAGRPTRPLAVLLCSRYSFLRV